MSFYDDEAYVRVENATTGATAYFRKAGLCFYGDSSTSFSLISDDVKTFYLFADVVRPAAVNVRDLLETLQAWVERSITPRESGPFVSDNTTTVIEVKTHHDMDSLRLQYWTRSGTITYDGGSNGSTMQLTTAQDARCFVQTKKHASIINNKFMYAVVSATLINSTSVRNVVSRAGCFDDDGDIAVQSYLRVGNGIFFQWKSSEGLSIVKRSNYSGAQVDEVILRADWNLDRLDGTGASLQELDPTQEATFVMEWSPMGGSSIRAGCLINGRVIWCHAFSGVRFGCGSFPIFWEIRRDDGALPTTSNDVASCKQGTASVMIQGNYEPSIITQGLSGRRVHNLTATSDPTTILMLRQAELKNRGMMWIRRIHFVNFDQGIAKWSLRMNTFGSTLGSAAFANATNSAVYSENAKASLGQPVFASGFVQPGVSFHDVSAFLYGNVWGVEDIAFVIVEYCRGACAISAAIEWVEAES